MNIEELKYPVGPFTKPEDVHSDELGPMIDTLITFPDKLESAVSGLTSEQLEYRYRPDGWNVRQLVHHLCDSHINCLIRVKLALTEESPTIKPYQEALWSELIDAEDDDLTAPLQILKGVHHKLGQLFLALDDKQWLRIYLHPQYGEIFNLKQVLANYEWHCRHHMAHIMSALEAKGRWNN